MLRVGSTKLTRGYLGWRSKSNWNLEMIVFEEKPKTKKNCFCKSNLAWSFSCVCVSAHTPYFSTEINAYFLPRKALQRCNTLNWGQLSVARTVYFIPNLDDIIDGPRGAYLRCVLLAWTDFWFELINDLFGKDCFWLACWSTGAQLVWTYQLLAIRATCRLHCNIISFRRKKYLFLGHLCNLLQETI